MKLIENKGIRTFGIQDCRGQLITKQDKVLKVWDEITEYLCGQKNHLKDFQMQGEELVIEDQKEPSKREVERSLQRTRRVKKAPSNDDIPVDVMKELDAQGLKKLTQIIIRIYEIGKWPKDSIM